jgi:hypothetical protein
MCVLAITLETLSGVVAARRQGTRSGKSGLSREVEFELGVRDA